MRFNPVKRPKVVRKDVSPRIVRRKAEMCPHCGTVERFKVLQTRRKGSNIVRYSVCTACGGRVTRIFMV